MAVHVRLRRMGAKKRPFYRIVAIDSRRARDAVYLDNLGTYNPIEKPAVIKVHEDRLIKWFDQGAQPSDTVHALLSQIGFLAKYEEYKKGKDVSEIELKTTIKERPKKTRQMKKAALKAEEEAKAKAEADAKAAEEAAKAEEEAKAADEGGGDEAPAEDAPAEEEK